MIVINLDQQATDNESGLMLTGWNFTISGATTGNGSYNYPQLGIFLAFLSPVVTGVDPATNFSYDQVLNSDGKPVTFNFLEYDSSGNLLPGQCIQFNNIGPVFVWNLTMMAASGQINYQLSAGKTIYFNISGPTGDSSTFSTTPCGSTAVKSLAINSKKYPNHPKYHGKAGRILLISTLVVLILILLGYFINKM